MNKDIIWWILVGSVILVVVFCIISVSIIIFKIIKTRNKVRDENYKQNEKGVDKVLAREDLGELLWDLKKLVDNPLDDDSLEFTINTILRNDYKKGWFYSQNQGYEIINISKKTNIETFFVLDKKIDYDKFNILLAKAEPNTKDKIKIVSEFSKDYLVNFVMINDLTIDWKDVFDNVFKHLNKMGMIFFYNTFKNSKNKKSFFSYLKLINIKHEEIKIGNGVILVVKN